MTENQDIRALLKHQHKKLFL